MYISVSVDHITQPIAKPDSSEIPYRDSTIATNNGYAPKPPCVTTNPTVPITTHDKDAKTMPLVPKFVRQGNAKVQT